MLRSSLLTSYLLFSLFSATAADLPKYATVTAERLQHPEPGNWLMYRGSYNSWGYSKLKQITRDNVQRLRPVWTYSTGMLEAHQAPPIVNAGMLFITTPQNHLLALDARSGELVWRYQRELPEDLFQLHPTNRGVALYGDAVYIATVDAHLIALDAQIGTPLWDQPVEDYLAGYYMTLAPLAIDGKILIGVSGGEFGTRGFIQAFAAADGKPLWKTYTIPGPGEPGHETWPGDSWKRGGAPVWVTGSYDPETKLTYWGTGNAGPWIGETRPGDNLYSSSLLALDVDTGAIRAHHQYHWNDSWDWDEVSAPLLVDLTRDGKTRKALVHVGRDGYLWLLERKPNAIGFIGAQNYVRQNIYRSLDPITGRPDYAPETVPHLGKRTEFCPSLWGGKDWPPAAYNPDTGYLYIPANENLCGAFTGEPAKYRPGELYLGVSLKNLEVFPHAQAKDHIGELQAWDLNAGKKVWTAKFPFHNWGPVLTTAGGLVFAGGTNDRNFRAFDAASGEVLWQQRTNSGVVGVPTAYEIDGVQYIAVQSGWGVDAQRKQEYLDKAFGRTTHVPQGGVLWVFALEKADLGEPGEPQPTNWFKPATSTRPWLLLALDNEGSVEAR
ncbi:MAG: PQQ-dependent dehydrogenase, methanol/ethanol family [Gammaproteobacteria bacterium]|nr:PQQ-dependent dehydrogenase, methanol/ethanol family [Gammaproteobacteria bacterium]